MNPYNLVVLRGSVISTNIVCNKKDKSPMFVEIKIAIPRTYLNKGVQKSDYPVVKYAKNDYMKYKSLEEGTVISITGSYYTENYKIGEQAFENQYVLADNIVIEKKEENIVVEQLELPY